MLAKKKKKKTKKQNKTPKSPENFDTDFVADERGKL